MISYISDPSRQTELEEQPFRNNDSAYNNNKPWKFCSPLQTDTIPCILQLKLSYKRIITVFSISHHEKKERYSLVAERLYVVINKLLWFPLHKSISN